MEEEYSTTFARVGWFVRSERRQSAFIVLLWAVSLAAVYLQAIYQRASLTLADDVVAFAICIIAGALLVDLGRAVLGYFIAIPAGMILTLVFVALPALDGAIPPPGDQVVLSLWIEIVFKLIFPAQFLLFLVGAVLGSFIGERYFY